MPNNLNNNASDATSPTTNNKNSGISPSQTVMNPLNQEIQLVSINQPTQLPIRLAGSTNYVTWKAQLDDFCLGYDLTSDIEGTIPCPSQIDPNYQPWRRQVNLLCHALMTFFDPIIAIYLPLHLLRTLLRRN